MLDRKAENRDNLRQVAMYPIDKNKMPLRRALPRRDTTIEKYPVHRIAFRRQEDEEEEDKYSIVLLAV